MAHKDGVFCDEGFKCTKCKEAWGKPTQIEQLTARVRELEEEKKELQALLDFDNARLDQIEDELEDVEYLGPYVEGIKVLKKQLAAAQEEIDNETAWQPIETAPKDKSNVVLLRQRCGSVANGYFLAEAYAGNGAWIWAYIHKTPTHWMPLPKAPNGASS